LREISLTKILASVACGTAAVALATMSWGRTPQAPLPSQANASATCTKSLLVNFETTRHDGEPGPPIPIWQVPGTAAFFFETGMAIDADGAPNAYNPDDSSGLDDLYNAGQPGDWWALALDEGGQPYIQGPEDPFPGFYISTTALWDRTKERTDPARFVDASKIPYIVLPGSVARESGARLGDLAVVFNKQNDKMSYAVFADIGPSVGEGSIALADNLGIRSSARRGGAPDGVLYLVFTGSGNGQPRPIEEINQEAQKLLQDEGAAPIRACTN
jgi:hypothetical protein